ncbi:MAG: hypothetical protein JXN63_06120 [Candidatus Delongbacteria bacterium]|nr:hypothetical protein [Candidatus Delongbacteria bacterium]
MKAIKLTVSLAALFSIMFFAGCDALDDFSVNVPFTVSFSDSTVSTQTSDSETYDLAENSMYQEYKEKIEDFEFLEARYFVTGAVPDTLTGTMKFTVRQNNADGLVLFYQEFPDVEVYYNKSDIFVLTSEQVKIFNDYLKAMYMSSGSTVFYGESVISGLDDDGSQKKVEVDLHLILKAKGTL